MKEVLIHLRTAVAAVFILGAIVCGAYPAIVRGLAQALFGDEASGSPIVRDGKAIGSRWLGQAFAGERYFHPRPSGAGNGYDASSSGGSNLGPTSLKLLAGTADDPASPGADESFAGVVSLVDLYRRTNGLPAGAKVPADAATRSGSGLDPHISPENARLQSPRVARARGMAADAVRAIVDKNTEGPDLGLFGEPRVNVLTLNLDLDAVDAAAAGGAGR